MLIIGLGIIGEILVGVKSGLSILVELGIY